MSKIPDHYTIGVRRKFLPLRWLFRKYLVTDHFIEGSNVSGPHKPWLVLKKLTGAVLIISDIENKDWKIFPNFGPYVERLKKTKMKAIKKADKTEETKDADIPQ